MVFGYPIIRISEQRRIRECNSRSPNFMRTEVVQVDKIHLEDLDRSAHLCAQTDSP